MAARREKRRLLGETPTPMCRRIIDR